MGYITRCNGPFSLEDLTARILKSSNFRFEWQFYQVTGIDLRSPIDIRCALDSIIARPDLHRFLQESFQRMYHNVFEIEPLNKHCQIVTASDEFENILASAAGDHLGAYSRELRPANASEKQKIRELFGGIGDYCAYQLVPGNVPDCSTCRQYNSYLFTTWFYAVAWDWCLFASWPGRELLWMGCLTDTD